MELKNVEKQEKSIVELTIAVSADELEAGKQAAFKKNRNKITVPGFRKGKAPRHLIEKLYGEGVFFEDAVNACYPDAYDKAVAEAGIKPVGMGDIEMKEIPEEGGFVFVAKVPVEPEVTLGEYKGLTAEKDEVKVLVADVKAELERMAQRVARTETVERAAKDGDTVVIDFEGFVDGAAFEGGKGENYSLTLGSGSFIPGFEDQLVGAKAGDELDVNVSFPEEYHAEELKGKPAVFKCKVHTVQETVMPKIDDEFAKDVSESCETLDDLKKELKDKLTETRQQEVDHNFEEQLLDALVGGMQADIPEAMFEAQTDNIVQDFAYRMQMQGMGIEQYVQMNGMDMASFRKLFRDQAERQVKVRLALQKIAEQEHIEIDDATLEEEYGKMAENYGLEVEKVKKAVAADALRSDLRLTKALDLVKETAKAKKKAKKKADAEGSEEQA
ncbi:trigger factor [Intestinibacillus massiliensis]|uniref:trigger factor n=1 Tax=Intestinibacillus massiliensis TaxID=1871029 RepID=UPI000B361CAD|nr:trigger factor [Intestinibacillus massiliensis]MCB6365475.1 trigger factor [Intestinibacillus massiliensis]